MKLEMVCIQLCQGAVSVGCTDKPYIVDSVPDHMVVVAFQKLAAFIPVVVQKPRLLPSQSGFSVAMQCNAVQCTRAFNRWVLCRSLVLLELFERRGGS